MWTTNIRKPAMARKIPKAKRYKPERKLLGFVIDSP
jgi:hypothetical protein